MEGIERLIPHVIQPDDQMVQIVFCSFGHGPGERGPCVVHPQPASFFVSGAEALEHSKNRGNATHTKGPPHAINAKTTTEGFRSFPSRLLPRYRK